MRSHISAAQGRAHAHWGEFTFVLFSSLRSRSPHLRFGEYTTFWLVSSVLQKVFVHLLFG